jgi:DNA-binding LacI/PurR family transcriptional regulator
MPATIKDIAKRLRISTSTVSYALNNGPKPVSDDLRRRVKAAADELGYRPNRVARNLVTGKAHAIGLVPPVLHRNLVASSFNVELLNGVVNALEERQLDLVLFTSAAQDVQSQIANLLDARVDGLLLIAPPMSSPLPEALHAAQMPFVVVSPGRSAYGACVGGEDAYGAQLALDHLIRLGHYEIAHVAGRAGSSDAIARREVYDHYVESGRISGRSNFLVQGDYTREGGYIAARELLSRKRLPTAIFSANDEMAVGIYQACRELSISIPHEISVVGYDDTMVCESVSPMLTSVRQSVEEMGYRAVGLLVDLVSGREAPNITFKPRLVTRQSTCPREDTQ